MALSSWSLPVYRRLDLLWMALMAALLVVAPAPGRAADAAASGSAAQHRDPPAGGLGRAAPRTVPA